MVDEKFPVLLSPPTSPRMSDAEAKTREYHSHRTPWHHQQPPVYSQHLDHAGDRAHVSDESRLPYEGSRHQLRSHKSFPASTTHSSSGRFGERCGLQPLGSSGPTPATSGASAPGSPNDQLTPRSDGNNVKDQQDNDDEIIEDAGEDPGELGETKEMTAAEIRAAKRKMKRFRLTHSQTRFLMSEFARQAHPDAAHRERLAREIPGLSARQVQVWFQNRRAKLKRLTSDDRDRMMQSRALPADFDTTQALHAPFGVQPSAMGPSLQALGGYMPYGESGAMRPLTVDTLRRVPEYDHYSQPYAAPSGVSPALGAFAFTPPQSSSEHISPSSTGMSPFMPQQHQSHYDRRPPSSIPVTSAASYLPQPTVGRLPLHERLERTIGEQPGSPLRTSLSFSALGSVNSQNDYHFGERSTSFSDHQGYSQQRPYPQRTTSGTIMGDASSYGLGFSYTHAPNCASNETQQRSNETEHYPRSAVPATTYSQYQHSSFTPQTQQLPQYSGYPVPYSASGLPSHFQQIPDKQHSHTHERSHRQPPY